MMEGKKVERTNTLTEGRPRPKIQALLKGLDDSDTKTKSSKPIDSQAICKDLRSLVTLGDPDKLALEDFFKDHEDYKLAFLEPKQANVERQGRGTAVNIFHHLVQGIPTIGWPDKELRAVLQWLFDTGCQTTGDVTRRSKAGVDRRVDNLLREELSHKTAMHMALDAESRKEQFVKLMLTGLDPVPAILPEVLCMPLKPKSENPPSQGNNCLHYAILQGSEHREAVFDRMKVYFEELSPDHWHPLRIQEPHEANTPLHLAINKAPSGKFQNLIGRAAGRPGEEFPADAEEKASLDFIKQLIKSYSDALEVANKDGQTPYQQRKSQLAGNKSVKYAVRVVQESLLKAKKDLTEPLEDTQKEPDEEELSYTSVIRNLIDSRRQSVSEWARKKKDNGFMSAEEGKQRCKALHLEAHRILTNVMNSNFKNSNCTGPQSEEFRHIFISDPVAQFIRNFCIRTMDREKVMKCLYLPGEELAIDFNLAGISRHTISDDYLRSFETHLRFEATLKQVVLPKLVFSVKKPKCHQDSKLPAKYKGRTDFTNIFNWLRKQQVRRILTVTVHDDDFPHHTDKAIVACLKGFHVETWNWRRVDLSSEVIFKASEDVRDISLYCSGNQAVLKGWSSKGGFEDRKKFPKLESIMVYLREGQEDSDTLIEYGSVFKNDLRMTIDSSLQDSPRTYGMVNEVPRNIEVQYTVDYYPYQMMMSGGTGMSDESGHRRITFLKNFATFFRNNPIEGVPPIKVAVLDDGLDPSLDMLKTNYTTIERGCAFYSSEAGEKQEYYAPSGNHGARVASLICSICPSTTLYIAKLEYERTRSGITQINTAAAVKAVKWAVQRGVDIINMSWTIECNSEAENPEELKDAIEEAQKQGIVIFCSASDQGGDSREFCYPAGYDATIAIGSLSVMDTPSVWLHTDQIRFMLPGERIVVQNNDGTMTEDSGSSFATAVATGLGGLLMYCTLALKIGSTSSMRRNELADPEKKDTKEFTWDNVLMKNVFKNLSGNIRGVGKESTLTRPEKIEIDLRNKHGAVSPLPLPEQELDDTMKQNLRDIFVDNLKRGNPWLG